MSFKRVFTEFKPRRRGLSKVLGDLEAAVMETVWKKGRVSVRDVYEELRRERQIAYTTVMTIMSRLADKKILYKEKQGIAYYYTPLYSKEEFTRSFVREVIDGLLEDYAEFAFSHFINRLQEEDEEKILELEKIIRERQRKGD
ncbi:BlaI/MecI/CopY family transcriptional regulator [Calderihabitans maritimus]|uniref:CopY family transcriptional repressor n=1 Tax=Calderihabitans maritimus TaxID=1246530 RepID=A0A1Z5HW42_9FIRM|nr:BlaI/MecI/CopY family transcriptional regulator [Calderihabitans maritimus]GAW93752.1 CopY family transcriptional repressor [Calderihabitans maritimus]